MTKLIRQFSSHSSNKDFALLSLDMFLLLCLIPFSFMLLFPFAFPIEFEFSLVYVHIICSCVAVSDVSAGSWIFA